MKTKRYKMSRRKFIYKYFATCDEMIIPKEWCDGLLETISTKDKECNKGVHCLMCKRYGSDCPLDHISQEKLTPSRRIEEIITQGDWRWNPKHRCNEPKTKKVDAIIQYLDENFK